MHSFVTSKNAQWRRLIWPTLYIWVISYGTLGAVKTKFMSWIVHGSSP